MLKQRRQTTSFVNREKFLRIESGKAPKKKNTKAKKYEFGDVRFHYIFRQEKIESNEKK